jgi:outer membrane protein assembly factor BamB
MKQLLLAAAFFVCTGTFAQTVFFSSPKTFSKEELKGFYASINMEGDLLLFNASDYTLYAFDKNSGNEKWNYNINWKSNNAPFLVGGQIWTKSGNDFIQLDTATGVKQKTFSFGSIETQPVYKDGFFYFTGIGSNGGGLYAYDPQKDTIVWSRFLAHGCQRTPYYLADKIIANAEGNNWIEVQYDGQLKDATCDTDSITFPSELPCAQQYFALSHEDEPIKGEVANDLSLDESSEPVILTSSTHTFILNEGKLTVLGNKLKKKAFVDLSLLDTTDAPIASYAKLLKADITYVWVVYNNHLHIYNHQKKRIEKTVNLSLWMPHQVIADNNNLWVISRKDGRLYGVRI